ncbi:MAG: long-chain fatty acid--CoA ligase [Planctomycetes bacterium]|nr:long-chain fatty acid--CoA ligase [Planctomycetota bacterium]
MIDAAEARSLHGLLRARAAATPDNVAYLERQGGVWRESTWASILSEVDRWRGALRRLGLTVGDHVALRCESRVHWVFFEQAALSLGCVVVPLYVSDRPENVAWIVNHAEARVLLLEDGAMWDDLRPHAASMPRLEAVLVAEDSDPGAGARSTRSWLADTDAHDAGDPHAADPDELATIVYTSGTTGCPKGVMLSHRNILDNCELGMRRLPLRRDDVLLSFLPMCHALERTCGYYAPMMAGATVAFARSVPDLPEDLREVRPTVLITVPRIFERVHGKIRARLADGPAWRERLFHRAVDVGWSRFLRVQGRGSWRPAHVWGPLLDRLVGKPMRARLGGRIEGALCGGAALRFDVARVIIALGIEVSHAYGLTECSPGVTMNGREDNRPETVGQPLTGSEIRIADDGELCVRSTSVMLGYWRDPEATARVIDADGWLHTGDLARIDDGFVTITGRKKEIIVLATGTKVPPDDLEASIMRDPLFEQILIVGEGRPFLAALVFIEPDAWERQTRGHGLPASPASGDETSEAFILQRISRHLSGFTGHARVRRVTAVPTPWTVESGLLTPTLKPKRERIAEFYVDEIERMYASCAVNDS